MSDLHCYHAADGKWPIDSYLTSNKLRSPSKDHPVQALIEILPSIIDSKVHYLLCPGDIANKSDQQGFIDGWGFVLEVGQALGVNEVIATLGNHDVDSRYLGSTNIYTVAKGIKKGYPIGELALCNEFWANGFTFVERESVRILVINSVFYHHHQNEIDRGRVDSTQLELIENYLTNMNDDKLQIALCHHHPLPHERFKLGTNDVIAGGNDLIDLLNREEFDLLIHGHKHDPWLRYAPGSRNSVPIFSAGSFSATTNHILNGKRNTFHLITLTKGPNFTRGKIKTWEYLPNIGWKLADSGEDGFPVYSGFGFKGTINELVNKTEDIIENQFLTWQSFLEKLPEVEFLTPDECIEFRNTLEEQCNIITYPPLPHRPKQIGKLHNP